MENGMGPGTARRVLAQPGHPAAPPVCARARGDGRRVLAVLLLHDSGRVRANTGGTQESGEDRIVG